MRAVQMFFPRKTIMYEEKFLNYDTSYEVIYEDDSSTYEEWFWIMFFQKDGKYFCCDGGSSPFFDNELPEFKDYIHEVSENELYEEIDKWEQYWETYRI